MERLQEAARVRSESMKASRRKRLLERKRVFMEKQMRKGGKSDENDADSKLRSVFAAIREHTNTDMDLNTDMTPGQLFTAVTQALDCPRHDSSANETRFVGEALELVQKLNVVLSSR